MSKFVCWLFLALTVRSLVPVASKAMPRSLTCEKELQDVGIEPAICEKIRSAVTSVRHAILDVDNKIRASEEEVIKKATEILRWSITSLKEQLPKYLPKRGSLDEKRESQVDLTEFRAVAGKAASGAVQAVKKAEQEIRDALIDTIAAVHSKHDDVSEAVRYILGKVISKRYTDEVSEAMNEISNLHDKIKASTTKAVIQTLKGFKDMLDYMGGKVKTLLQDKVDIGFFEHGKAQITALAAKTAEDLEDFYNELAMKSVNAVIVKVNELIKAVYDVKESIQKDEAVFTALSTLQGVVEKESERVKDTIHSEENNPEAEVADDVRNAAKQMLSDYNVLVADIVNSA